MKVSGFIVNLFNFLEFRLGKPIELNGGAVPDARENVIEFNIGRPLKKASSDEERGKNSHDEIIDLTYRNGVWVKNGNSTDKGRQSRHQGNPSPGFMTYDSRGHAQWLSGTKGLHVDVYA